MNIILLKKINNLGKEGDKIKVKSGYARNFLIPKNKAIIYNIENEKNFEFSKNKLNKQIKIRYENKCKIYEEISKLNNIVFNKKTNKNGKLFDSINEKEIINYIKNLYKNLHIYNIKIILNKKIKTIGNYLIKIIINKNILNINLIVKENNN